jgi:3-phosphoshikimate 1-carboxyvinyltransferase
MKKLAITPIPKSIHAEVSVPGSIGYTIRALNIAAMTKGNVKIINPLKSDDTYKMVSALKTLGIKIEEKNNYFLVKGHINDVKEKKYYIDIGLSGRTARTILALASIVKGEKIISCEAKFKNRPVSDLVEGLRELGAKIEYLEKNGFLPLKISSSRLESKNIEMKGDLSSQYFSALLMIGPMIGGIKIKVKGNQASKPFIDMTCDVMDKFGVVVQNKNYSEYIVKPDQTYKNPTEYIIEPEATSASYFFAFAAITGSTIRVLNLNPKSRQGDVAFADILQDMGCAVKKNVKHNWVEVKGGGKLFGKKFDMNGTPDLVPTLAIVAAFARGKTVMNNIAHVRIKESDRIDASKTELSKLGIAAESTKDSLIVTGSKIHGAEIDTHNDHRIAMSFALAGTKIPGVVINNPNVVNKSFPEFWDKLEKLGVQIKRRSN